MQANALGTPRVDVPCLTLTLNQHRCGMINYLQEKNRVCGARNLETSGWASMMTSAGDTPGLAPQAGRQEI